MENGVHDGSARLSLRPYQLMCVVCEIGSGRTEDLEHPRLTGILRIVRSNPNIPTTLRCNVDSVYRYQNPGGDEDTPEGGLFNLKRDLDLLQRLGLVPGATRPARELFQRLLKEVATPKGICGYDAVSSEVWRGCAVADSGNYERGCAKGIAAIIPPRNGEEMADQKRESAQEIHRAATLLIRPHHLMCMTCVYGGLGELAPTDGHNVFEVIQVMCANPEIPVALVSGCDMICQPCPSYDPQGNLCVAAIATGLRDQKKDLDVLQRLGLQFGDVLPARRLLRLLYERIASTRTICGYGDGIVRSPEWTICSEPAGSEAYVKGRAAGLGILKE